MEQDSPTQEEGTSPIKDGEITVPRWVILVTFGLGWSIGGTMIGFELAGNARLSVMILGAWLVTLPLVAGNPFAALREMVSGMLGSGKERR